MSRILAIRGPDGEREVDYSLLSSKEIEKKIKGYKRNTVARQVLAEL